MAEKESIAGKDPRDEDALPSKDQFIDNPEEHESTREQYEQEIETGEKNESIYTQEGREELLEDGEIAPWEEGFAEGAESDAGGHGGKCEHCGEILSQDMTKVVKKRTNHEVHWFCSSECAEKYEE